MTDTHSNAAAGPRTPPTAGEFDSAAARRRAHRRLACELEACPHATGVQYHAPGEGPHESAYASTAVLAQVTVRGTVHPRVQALVCGSELGLVDVIDANSPDYKQVVVR